MASTPKPQAPAFTPTPVATSTPTYQHADEDGNSLHNTFGFKQQEGTISSVFRFSPAAKNLLITDKEFEQVQM